MDIEERMTMESLLTWEINYQINALIPIQPYPKIAC